MTIIKLNNIHKLSLEKSSFSSATIIQFLTMHKFCILIVEYIKIVMIRKKKEIIDKILCNFEFVTLYI